MLHIGGNIGAPTSAHSDFVAAWNKAVNVEVIQREIDELFDAILEEEKEVAA